MVFKETGTTNDLFHSRSAQAGADRFLDDERVLYEVDEENRSLDEDMLDMLDQINLM